jgi:hypothetical protein
MVGDLMNIKKLRINYTKHTFNPLYSHMKRAKRDNLTQIHDYRWRVLPIYIGTGYLAIEKQIIDI